MVSKGLVRLLVALGTVMVGLVVVLVWKIATGRMKPAPPPTCADFADVAREKVPARCFRDFDPEKR
jgi:hypothetical protein